LYQKTLILTLGAAPWMAWSSPAMTVIDRQTEDFVIAGLDPAIHGMSQCLRELALYQRMLISTLRAASQVAASSPGLTPGPAMTAKVVTLRILRHARA
jgi:hypothetical protein